MLRAADGRAAFARAASHCARRSPRSSSERRAAPSTPAARSSSRTAPCTRSGSASARSSGRGTRSSSPPRASSSRARSGRPARSPSTSTAAPQTAGAGMPRRSRRAVGPRTRALLLCNPGNPTGHVPTREEVDAAVGGRGPARAPRRHRRGLRGRALGRQPAHLRLRARGGRGARPQPRQEPLVAAAPPWNRFRLRRGCSSRARRTLEWDVLRVDLAAQTAALAVLDGPRDWLDAVHAGARRGPRRRARRRRRDAGALDAAVPAAAPFLFVHADSGEPVGEESRPRRAPGRRRRPLPGAGLRAAPLRRGGTGGRRARRRRSPAGPSRRPGRASARAEAAARRRGGRSR